MLILYFFRFFLLIFWISAFAIIFMLYLNVLAGSIIEKKFFINDIFFQIIDSSIFFGELVISLSFVIAFVAYTIKFSKSNEFIAMQSLGISNLKTLTPIFLFSVLCGLLIYTNQSYFAAYRETDLLKTFNNHASNWIIQEEKIAYYDKEKEELTYFHIKPETFQPEKIELYKQNKKEVINLSSEYLHFTESSSNPNFLDQNKKYFLNEKNFFYLTFQKIFPFFLQKETILSYVFFQKIADMLVPMFLFFILLGNKPDPRNITLIQRMIFRTFFCILFLLTNQIGIFLFKASYSYPFLSAFYNHLFWGMGLTIKYIRFK